MCLHQRQVSGDTGSAAGEENGKCQPEPAACTGLQREASGGQLGVWAGQGLCQQQGRGASGTRAAPRKAQLGGRAALSQLAGPGAVKRRNTHSPLPLCPPSGL